MDEAADAYFSERHRVDASALNEFRARVTIANKLQAQIAFDCHLPCRHGGARRRQIRSDKA